MGVQFQNTVNRYKPIGVPGDFADTNYNHMYPLTLIAKDGDDVPVTIGKFVWDNGDGTGSGIGTGQPTGLAHRVMDIPLFDIREGATMIVPPAYKVAVADVCTMFVEVSDTPAIGNHLYVNNTTGVITNAAAGETVSGATETNFVIKMLSDTPAAAGNVCVVTNWNISNGGA